MGSAASTHSDGESSKPRAVLLCHASQERSLRALLLAVAGGGEGSSVDDLVIVTDVWPHDRQRRAELLSQTQAAFVAVDPMLQQSAQLIETLSYLKDQRKAVIAGPLTFFSRPSGAVGAVCLALGRWEPLLFTEVDRLAVWAERYDLLTRSALELKPEDEDTEPERSREDAVTSNSGIEQADGPVSPQIFFVFCEDGARIAAEFAHNDAAPGDVALSGSVSRCQHSLESDLTALQAANIGVFVITEACTTNDEEARHFRVLFERAIAWGKPLLPIKEQRAPLHGWLALAMAGRLWYQVDATQLELVRTPYAQIPGCPCKVDDACLATDFVLCANGLLTMPQRTLERAQIASREAHTLRLARERAQVLGLRSEAVGSLCSRVEELVKAASSNDGGADWSSSFEELQNSLKVATTHEAVELEATATLLQVPPPEELLPERETEQSSALKPIATIRYTVTRLGFVPPPAVLDGDGQPIVGLQLDAMLSYQWGSQREVLDVHQQGQVHNLRAWLDVYGHMQGNVNSAMAAAVESVACVVVFLTKAYLASVNCCLEFLYAARCRKPMVFAFLEDPATLELPGWVTSVAGTEQFNVYPSLIRETEETAASRILALDMRAERVRGVPMTDVLFGAIRRLAAWRSQSLSPVVYDGSLLLYATTSALHQAVAGLASTGASEEGAASQPTLCSRCGAPFTPEIPASLEGCRRHTAYYMGGSLLAGRWVCCQESQRDGPGCQPAQHMTDERSWTLDSSYGTHTYEPNP
ncbi:hypothetical protein BBJ28_00020248 [Nothophytophthora sp. Chile5]|nr:hypothetical protein BBJ28_00020248 [Nothophytophthora sp. Chile5]